MAGLVLIKVAFPFEVEMPKAAHRALHDAIEIMCAEYERTHPDRVMWAAGEGGTPPPGFFFDAPKGDWDMSVLNIEVAERERYDTDRAFKLKASAELRDHITKEIERLQRGIERYSDGVKSDNSEFRIGSQSFLRKYERELRVYRLAQHALGTDTAPAQDASQARLEGTKE